MLDFILRNHTALLLKTWEHLCISASALAAGGTSFDSLYVNVNGESGYFERGLDAYGREDQPCRRCATPVVRRRFANRSSFLCPRCQRLPKP